MVDCNIDTAPGKRVEQTIKAKVLHMGCVAKLALSAAICHGQGKVVRQVMREALFGRSLTLPVGNISTKWSLGDSNP
jgi:hypothetical protein